MKLLQDKANYDLVVEDYGVLAYEVYSKNLYLEDVAEQFNKKQLAKITQEVLWYKNLGDNKFHNGFLLVLNKAWQLRDEFIELALSLKDLQVLHNSSLEFD